MLPDSSALQIGLWIIAGGVVLNFALGAVKLWGALRGAPERRAVNVLAENATAKDVNDLAERIKQTERDIVLIRHEAKTDREALSKAAEERAHKLIEQIIALLSAVSELRGVVNEMREQRRLKG